MCLSSAVFSSEFALHLSSFLTPFLSGLVLILGYIPRIKIHLAQRFVYLISLKSSDLKQNSFDTDVTTEQPTSNFKVILSFPGVFHQWKLIT